MQSLLYAFQSCIHSLPTIPTSSAVAANADVSIEVEVGEKLVETVVQLRGQIRVMNVQALEI